MKMTRGLNYEIFVVTIVVTVMSCCHSDAHHTYGNYSGDIVLAAYFPVHGSTADLAVPLGYSGTKYCGNILEEDGIQVRYFHNNLLQ